MILYVVQIRYQMWTSAGCCDLVAPMFKELHAPRRGASGLLSAENEDASNLPTNKPRLNTVPHPPKSWQ
jgi:hypothetical protein